MEVRRIGPDGGFLREFTDVRKRVQHLETRPSGKIVVRETMETTDPETGVKTIFGALPDGSYGIQPFVYDITPPPVATTPIVFAEPGMFTVSWDGGFVDDAEQPKDFVGVNVIGHKIVGGETVSSVAVSQIRVSVNRSFISTDIIPVGETWQFSFESEDYNGNLSERSARSAIFEMKSLATDLAVETALADLAQATLDAEEASAAAQLAADAAQDAADLLALDLTATDEAVAAAQLKADQAFNLADQAAENAGDAQDTADGKGTSWYLDDAPAGIGHKIGDIWFDKNDGYKVHTWDGTTWLTVQDSALAQFTAESKGRTYTQNVTPPVEARLPQNLWNDTSLGEDKVVVKYWSTVAGAWTPLADKAATEARTVADSKGETIYSSTTPTVEQRLPQNLWIDTTGGINIHKRWDGSGWVVVADLRISETVDAVIDADDKAQNAWDAALTKGIVYTQNVTPPVEARLPQNLWVDTSLGLTNTITKYWNGSAWTAFADKTATDAAVLAGSKSKVIYASTAPTGLDANVLTLWIDTTGGANTPKKWVSGTTWTAVTDKVASDAATLAAAKSETIYSTTAPAAAKQLPQNLWIDTTGGINIHKRWDGSGWVVVADTRIASSAVAVTAAQSKADSAFDDAADAQLAADNAQDAADLAKLNADKAIQSSVKTYRRSGKDTVGIVRDSALTVSTITSVASDGAPGGFALQKTGTANNNVYDFSGIQDFNPDLLYRVSFKVRVVTDATVLPKSIYAGVLGLQANGTTGVTTSGTASFSQAHYFAANGVTLAAAAGWQTYTGYFKGWNAAGNGGTHADPLDPGTVHSDVRKFVPMAFLDYSGGNGTWELGSIEVDIVSPEGVQAIVDAAAAQLVADQAFSDADSAAEAAGTAQLTADSKNRNWYQTTAPAGTGHKDGDQWFDTDDLNRLYLWKGTPTLAWVSFQDGAIAAAQGTANSALGSANGKNRNYYQTAMPTGGTYILGDTWFDTDDGFKIYVHNGTTFIASQDGAINTAQNAANSKTKTFVQGTTPAAITTGDIWIDTANGNVIKTWEGSSWVNRADTAIATAQSAAVSALGSANGKNRNYYQTTQPSGGTYIAGDTWFDTDDGNQIYVHNGTTWVVTDFGASAIADLAITNAKIADATIQSAKIGSVDAGTITVGTLNAARIGANSIDADKVVIGRGSNLYMDEALLDSTFYSTTSYVIATGGRNGKGSVYVSQVDATQRGTYYAISNLTTHKARRARVVAGQSYRIGAWVQTSAAAPLNTVRLTYRLYRETDNAFISPTPTSIYNDGLAGRPGVMPVDTWVWLSGVIAIPAGTEYTSLALAFYKEIGYSTGTTRWSDPTIQQMGSGELIVDGAIQAGSAIIGAGAIGTAQIGDAQITTAKIGDAQITNAKIVDATIQSAKIGSVDAGTITVGTLNAARIGANSISASQLLISDFSNLLENPDFETGDLSGWTITGGWSVNNSGPATGVYKALTQYSGATQTLINNAKIYLKAGEKVRVKLFTYAEAPTSGTQISIGLYNTVGAGLEGTTSPVVTSNPFVESEYVITAATAGMKQLRIATGGTGTGYLRVDNIRMYKMNAGELIVDGAILTQHMTSGTIDAGVLTAGSVKAAQIGAKSITSDKLVISSTNNLVVEADFGNGGSSWEIAPAKPQITINATAGRGSLPAMRVTGTVALQSSLNKVNRVAVGTEDRFRGAIWVKSTAALAAGKILLRMRCYTTATANTDITVASSPLLVANAWTNFEGISPVLPAATIAVEFYLEVTNNATGTITDIDYVSVTRAADGKLIVDGALDAKTITGSTIQTIATANTGIKLTSTELAGWSDPSTKAFSLTSAGALTLKGAIQSGSTIEGTLVTGSSGVQTSVVATAGVKLNNTGIKAYDAGNNLTFHLDATTGLLEVPGLKANAIKGDMIDAGTISAGKLLVGSGDNLIPDPGYLVTNVTAIRNTNSTMTVTKNGTTGNLDLVLPGTGNYYFRATGVAQTAAAFADWIPVTPGDQYLFAATVVTPGSGDLRITGRTKDGQALSIAFSTLSPFVYIASGVRAVYKATIPADCYWMLPEIRLYGVVGTATIAPNALSLRQMATGELIVDGAIDSKLITAPTIQTDTGATTGIKLTPTELAGWDGTNKNFSLTSAGALTLKGAIQSGSTIEGATITGTTGIQTSATTDRGVKIKSTGVSAYDGSGNLTFKVDGTTGLVEAPGIKANSISGDKLAVNTVTVENMRVGDFTNHVTNGFGELGTGKGLGTGFIYETTDKPTLLAGVFKTTAGQGTTSALATLFDVTPNTEYITEVWLKASIPNSRIYIELRDQASAHGTTNMLLTTDDDNNPGTPPVVVNASQAGYALSNYIVPTVWTKYTIRTTTTATATKLRIGSLYFNHPNGSELNAVVSFAIGIRRRLAGNLIVDGAILTQHMTSGTIDAGVLTVGSITAPKIAAKSITVDKLVISSTDNLVIEGDFSNSGTSWQMGTNKSINATAGRGSLPAYRVTGTVSAITALNLINRVPVGAGDRFRGTFYVKSTVALVAAKVLLRIRCYTTATAYTDITAASNPILVAGAWTLVEGISPALPANTIAVEFYTSITNNATGTITDIDYVSVTRAADGNLVVDGAITATKLETSLVLASTIIAGDPTGTHAEMSPQGFRVYADAVEVGAPSTEVVRLGVAATNDYFAITKADGSLAATISQDGVISGSQINANDELFYKGEELTAVLNRYPRGPLYKAELSADIDNITTEYGLVEGEYVTDGQDRQIELELGIKFYPNAAGDEAYVSVRYTSDGSTPSITSPKIFEAPLGVISSTSYDSKSFKHTIRPYTFVPSYTTGMRLRFLMTVTRGNGASLRVRGGLYTYMYINDVGQGIVHTPSFNPGGGSNPAPPPPVPAQQTYVKQYGCYNSMNYQGNNNQYNFDTGRMYQGLSPAGYGNLKSIGLFDRAAIQADLSGASINYVRVYFYFAHWYYNSGGLARIGVHNHTGIPGTATGLGPMSVFSGGWPKPGARWVDLSSSHWEGWKNAYGGVWLEGDSSYGTYGYADRPTLEISYNK